LVRSFVAHLEENGPGVAGDVEYTAAGGDGGGGASAHEESKDGSPSLNMMAPRQAFEFSNSTSTGGA
jgi:hypothetical protein